MRFLKELSKNFKFTTYKAGGNYRVGVTYLNEDYLINTDGSVFRIKHNNVYLSLKDYENLESKGIELFDLDNSYELEIIEDFESQFSDEEITKIQDEKVRDFLFNKYKLLKILTKKAFYHISSEILKDIDIFKPGIPSIRMYKENDKTKRICVSDSIQGCLSAMPESGSNFEKRCFFFEDQLYSCIFKVYEFDREDILKENLITPPELFKSGEVLDAEETHEYWVLNQNLKPKKSFFIQVTNYEEEDCDIISYEDLKDCDKGIKNFDECIDGHFTILTDVSFELIPKSKIKSKYNFNLDLEIDTNYNQNFKHLLKLNPTYTPDINSLKKDILQYFNCISNCVKIDVIKGDEYGVYSINIFIFMEKIIFSYEVLNKLINDFLNTTPYITKYSFNKRTSI